LKTVPSSTDGIEEYRSMAFNGALRGNLLVQHWDSSLYRAVLAADGRSITTLATVPGTSTALDVLAGPGGAIIGIDYSGNAVKVSLPKDVVGGTQAYDIFPWRARPDTSATFVIGGLGFGAAAGTSVTIGGVPATIMSVSPTRIYGIVPTVASPTSDLLDVVVQSGGATSVIPGGFRYVLPHAKGIGRWVTGPSLPAAMGEVAGGIINGVLYLVGHSNAATLAYDLAQEVWISNLPQRPFKGDHHAVEVVDGKLYVFGGLGSSSEGKVQIFNPSTQQWTLGANMPFASGSASSAVIAGKVYVAGGIVSTTTVAAAAVYDPVTNAWASIASMPQGRNHAASGTDGRLFYVFGGRGAGSGDGNFVAEGFDDVQIYNPATNSWTTSSDPNSTIAPLPQKRGGTGKAAFLGGEFYVIGGETTSSGTGQVAGNVYNRVDVYDPVSNIWRQERPLPTARHGIFPLAYDGKIFVAGGGVQAGHSLSDILEIFSR
jgi:N-acetylneuraminic acid mutarotase